ncbi:hypothetical protein CWB41_04650 [Methylovirgula ligni]|uniref:Uncharacterized protein n=1 Tax=Methylovirgula ligni TaxID=569860 RepID=A0A3D9Z4A6_9HYPH|nr:hypothetical protein [Methylovirgula ligni]QAY95104.1 hypothetical protein CWB41_04650 [Methylovirgula ligni]REF89615.1 hypothetical protein DES32_0842 [Methylovirgula ligni]
MTKLKPAPAAEPSVADAERAVSEAALEFADIKARIASAEAALPRLALDPDDSKFEEASLQIDRLKRSKLRAQARLEQAKAALIAANARAKESRRKALYDAGLAAEAEIKKLVDEYGRRAAAVVEVLREIATHADAINVASENRPLYSPLFDVRGLYIGGCVVLPSAHDEHGYIWSRGEPEPEDAETTPTPATPFMPRARPLAGEKLSGRTLPDGTRRITLPPSDWGTPREYTEVHSHNLEAN